MKVFLLVLLVPIVNSLRPPRWAQQHKDNDRKLVTKKIIRPNVFNVVKPPKDNNKISYQYYDESWRKEQFDDQGDYGDDASAVDSRTDWDLDALTPPQAQITEPNNAQYQYPENIWFVFPRAMASKIREFAWHYYNIAATRARQKKKRQTKQSESSSKPIAYQYYDESWLRKDDSELKNNYDDFSDDEYGDTSSSNRFKRDIAPPDAKKELNESYASNHTNNFQSAGGVDENNTDGEKNKVDDSHKLEKNIQNVVRRSAYRQHHSKQSVTDYLFDTFFGITEQILAVKNKEREIAKEYLSEEIDVLEVLISQDAKQLSKYLISKSLLQKLDQIMAVQVGTTLLLKEYKERNISKKQFYDQIQLAFSNNEQDQLTFLNTLVESNPGLAFVKKSDTHFSNNLRDQKKKNNKKTRRAALEKISESALKNIIKHYITVHFEVAKNIFRELYNEGKISKKELDRSIEELKQANTPEKNKIFRETVERKLNAEIASSMEYGKQLLIQEYQEGKITKERYDREINHPNTVNVNKLKMKILKSMIEQELDKIPRDDDGDVHKILKDVVDLYSINDEEREPHLVKQDVALTKRVIQNLKRQIFKQSN